MGQHLPPGVLADRGDWGGGRSAELINHAPAEMRDAGHQRGNLLFWATDPPHVPAFSLDGNEISLSI